MDQHELHEALHWFHEKPKQSKGIRKHKETFIQSLYTGIEKGRLNLTILIFSSLSDMQGNMAAKMSA